MLVFVSRNLVLLVSYIVPAAKPTYLIPFEFLFGVYAGFHPLLVETCGFGEVQNVELYLVDLLLSVEGHVFVNYFEIVPLGVAFGIEIVF